MKQRNIFLIGGLTGGPLIPLLAISKNLPEYKPIIIGVKNGFETTISANQKIDIEYLPKAKLNLLTFSNQNLWQTALGVLDLFVTIFLLLFSVMKCAWLLFKYRPKAILSAGSFLAVPMVYTIFLLRKLGLISTKIIIHQQDPLPGLANRLTIKLADMATCTFEHTHKNFPDFARCEIIPNPIDFDKFDQAKVENIESEELRKFFDFNNQKKDPKPIFLIFGGGSGAKVINDWVSDNLEQLLEHFRVIHLTGELQVNPQSEAQAVASSYNKGAMSSFSKRVSAEQTGDFSNEQDYLTLSSLTTDMPAALKFSDVVLCRAGLGSITELQYLNKQAFLVPILNSHQELNAKLVADKFIILEQREIDDWLDKIIQINSISPALTLDNSKSKDMKQSLESYYSQIEKLLAKT